MINKNKIIIVSILFLLLAVFVYNTYISNSKKDNLTSNLLSLSEEQVENNALFDMSEIDYTKYLDIKMAASEIVYNKTTEEMMEDSELCSIIYRVKLKNISDETIGINFRLYIPREITRTIIMGDTTLGPRKNDVILKPGQGLRINFGTLMKHTDKLSEAEKKLFQEYHNTLFLHLTINGKSSYLIL